MKVNIFKKLIREVVREELDFKFSALEKKLDEVLVSSNNSSLVEDSVSQPTASSYKKMMADPVKTNKSIPPLTKDSILNDILNETAAAGDWKNIDREAEVKSVKDSTQNLPDHLADALNKDYSQVMQKVEEKARFKNGA
tara:strand:+ start:443 stop:859 length:417 start_codon:yes stop_codon:yes gene_type:complete